MARTRKQKAGRLQEPKKLDLMDIIQRQDVTDLETLFTDGKIEELDYIDDKRNITPLKFAIQQGNARIVKMLVKHGADPFFEDAIVLAMGKPELFKALINDHSLCLSIYTHNIDLVKAIIDVVKDVNIFCDSNQNTPLSHAVSSGTLDMVNALIAAGANIDSRDISGSTPLHYGANTGRLDMVNALIASGADVNAKDNDGGTPLHFAVDYEFTDVVKALIAAGAHIDEKKNDGRTALHLAALYDNVDIVKILIANSDFYSPFYVLDNDGNSALQLAQERNPQNIDIINAFLLTPSRTQTSLPETPLPESPPPLIGGRASEEQQKTLVNAVKTENIEGVRAALTPESDIDEALKIAIRNNTTEIVRLLLTQSNISDEIFFKALRRAAEYSGQDILDVIKEAIIRVKVGAEATEQQVADIIDDFITITDGNRNTLLHLAVKSFTKDRNLTISMLEALLNSGVDIEAKNRYAETPLHYAAEIGCVPTLTFLLDKGAKIEATDDRGETPLHKAVNSGCKDAVNRLISREANVNARDKYGDIPLAEAVYQFARGIDVESNEEIVRALIASGSNINSRNNTGLTVLHVLTVNARENSVNAVKLMLKLGADKELKTTDGYEKTSLLTALTPSEGDVSERKLELARLLVDNGADVNAKDFNDKTPLHMACFLHNGTGIARLLIDKGANLDAKTKSGSLPIHFALTSNLKDVVLRLVEKGADIRSPFATSTPLELALSGAIRHEDMALAIIGKLNDDEIKRSNGMSAPIHKAAQNGFLRVVKELVRRGVDINTPTSSGKTALQLALDVTPRNPEMVAYLSKADPETADI